MLEVRIPTGRGILNGIRAETDELFETAFRSICASHGTCQGKTDLRVARQFLRPGACALCSSPWRSSGDLRR